jgi:membrane protease YdiL (CAAX protease family)
MKPLHEAIRRLPASVEFLVVVTWAFGLPIFASILSIGADPALQTLDNAALVSLLAMEVAQFLLVGWFLQVRGWTLQKIGIEVTWRGTAMGLVLLAGIFSLLTAIDALGSWVAPVAYADAQSRYPQVAAALSMQLVFIASVVNGFYEEIFVAGYVITALKERRGLWVAINVSTGLRLLYHLYQGPLGVLYVVPVGLIFGFVYARWGGLWPLIVAHILIDVVSLTLGRGGP